MLSDMLPQLKSNAERDTEAAKMAVKEAVSDLEMVRRPDYASASTGKQQTESE